MQTRSPSIPPLYHVKSLINMMGAYVAKEKEISTCSYLICGSASGEYENIAIEGNAFMVTKEWLEDCIKEWNIISVDNYTCKSSKMRQLTPKNPRNYRRRTDWGEPDIRTAWSTEKKKRKESPANSNSSARHASSTGHTRPSSQRREADAVCRKRLNFDWKLLSAYKGSELVVTVQIPESSIAKETGAEVIKEALLRAFTELSNIHNSDECIGNSFSSDSIRVSLNSDEAAFENAQLVVYTDELARLNKQQFILLVQKLFRDQQHSVPEDIRVWLDCISIGVPDRVLKRHINMLDPNSLFGCFGSMYYIVARLKEKDLTTFNKVVGSQQLQNYRNWGQKFKWRPLENSLHYINPKILELHNLKSKHQTSGGAGQSICRPKSRDTSVFGLLELILIEHPNLLSDLQRALYALGLLK